MKFYGAVLVIAAGLSGDPALDAWLQQDGAKPQAVKPQAASSIEDMLRSVDDETFLGMLLALRPGTVVPSDTSERLDRIAPGGGILVYNRSTGKWSVLDGGKPARLLFRPPSGTGMSVSGDCIYRDTHGNVQKLGENIPCASSSR